MRRHNLSSSSLRLSTDNEYGIPNLEKQIGESPAMFVQLVDMVFKRTDDGEYPQEWKIENSEQRAAIASSSYRLLDNIKTIPGTGDDENIDVARLSAWLKDVRRLCHVYDRADIGDQCIGQLLARAPAGENGTWPCESVCTAMEEIASAEIGEGFSIGVRNARGVHWRGEGGAQERELAAKYRSWAERLHFDYPYVGGILEDIAASYDREARWEDSEAKVTRRLRH